MLGTRQRLLSGPPKTTQAAVHSTNQYIAFVREFYRRMHFREVGENFYEENEHRSTVDVE